MIKRNKNLTKLPSSYLFWEINRRKKEFASKNPEVKIISLGIGDTTEPLTPHVVEGLSNSVMKLASREGYTGYGPSEGMPQLRKRISEVFYKGLINSEDIFISDGCKCDIGRLQLLFGKDVTIAVQDPSYPVYIDGGVIIGQTGDYDEKRGQFDGIVYMKCTEKNNFFPDLNNVERTDIIYFCSPNNPTGAVSSREQLASLVDFARKNRSIIIFDAAYSQFIRDEKLPKSIYEIEGARETAIEMSSFSKIAGFTGVRLGWTVVPSDLKYEDGYPVKNDFLRIITTIFNGSSAISQHGGLAVLDDEGIKETRTLIDYYLENARIIKTGFERSGFDVYGGGNSPYIWIKFKNKTSWDAFDEILERCNVVTTPGSGFGPAAEGFIRISAFGQREDIIEAVRRIQSVFAG